MQKSLFILSYSTFGVSFVLYALGGGRNSVSISLTFMVVLTLSQVFYEFYRENIHGSIVYFCAVYFMVYGLKAIYVLLFSPSAFEASRGAESFEVYEQYFYSAVHVATFCFALTVGVYNLVRGGIRTPSRPPIPNLTYRVTTLFAVGATGIFAIFLYANGGISFVTRVLSNVWEYRQGDLQVRFKFLSVAIFVGLYPLLLVYYYAARKGYLRVRTIVFLVGVLISYLQAGSVSQTVLFVITTFAIESYDQARVTEGSSVRYFVLWVFAGIFIIVLSVLLKFYFSATAQFAREGSNLFDTFWKITSRYSGDIKFLFDYIFGKLNAIDILAVEMSTLGEKANYFGVIYFVDGMLSFFPQSLVGLNFQIDTLGNHFTDVTGIGPKYGGVNLRIVGAFYSVGGISTAMLGMSLFGYLIARVERKLIEEANTGMDTVLGIAFSTYFVLYFTYTGTPRITLRRFTWFVIMYLIIKVANNVVRTAANSSSS